MSAGKIIGIGSAIVIVLLLFYVMSLGGSSTSSKATSTQERQATEVSQKAPAKSAEEKKLDELKSQARELSQKETSVLYASKCSACHGKGGEGREIGTMMTPSIQGKSEEYILGKLEDYRENRVENTFMTGLLNNSTDEELRALAKEISSF